MLQVTILLYLYPYVHLTGVLSRESHFCRVRSPPFGLYPS